MSFRIALQNVRKSYRDYLIYFVTLTFSVALFYVFGSVDYQLQLLDVSSFADMTSSGLQAMMLIFSVLIVIIFYFLIRYANNFLIRRRNKEFATYLILGMPQKTMGMILVMETLIIGVLSLVSGIIVGIIMSQVTSVFTAFILSSDINYKFIYSAFSMRYTVFCFALIFLFISYGNIRKIRKLNLINIMNSGRENQTVTRINVFFGFVTLVIAIALLVLAYVWVLQPYQLLLGFPLIVLLGTLATLLLFYSIAYIFMNVMTWFKRSYYWELNMFTFRQLGSRVKTTYTMMTFISVIMLFALVLIVTGINLNRSIFASVDVNTPYDYSIILEDDTVLKDFVNQNKASIATNMTYTYYKTGLTNEDLTVSEGINILGEVYVMKLSDYNRVRAHFSQPSLTLDANHALFDVTSQDTIMFVYTPLETVSGSLTLDSQFYRFSSPKASPVLLMNSGPIDYFFIINDDELERMLFDGYLHEPRYVTNLVVKEGQDIEHKISEHIKSNDYIQFLSKHDVVGTMDETRVIITYITLYLGMVFLVSAMVVQSLHSLSDAHDSKRRYTILYNIGVDQSEVNRSIRTQTLIYFLLPMGLALIHTYVGIQAVKLNVERISFASFSLVPTLITLGIVVIFYSVFYYFVYLNIKRIVRQHR
ncbi:hypothetical protein G7062_05445 [Erysipelothrix sp. HDW6C]|uniref:FtsX-like permease family protein n=1 Tax=Erysipelothrix sp. HDW6C TaxID=2714930 RepID=UPI00140E79FC|nr:FtsX-like permease family protein [Erysipelothrix sp. HDW6C]QIK69774.1 hypothetical protein G7062_05445 [Erysipelothrix sp. HDW6C]